MALPLFALTLFVSAFLLFLVQPMIGKMILPKLGGTPQVWNTCMMFFQMTLLLGYFYTHSVSTKLSVRRQIVIHGMLLLLPFLFLIPNGPFNVTGWIPPAGSNPIFATLLLLAMVVGVPFLVVSTSAPLLQKWFANTGHPTANDPYFLYGASNLGSLLSLICYPFLIEPWIPLRYQAYVWTVAYLVLGGLILASAGLVWKSAAGVKLAGGPELDVPPLGEIPQPPPTLAPPEQPVTAVKSGPAPSTARTGISRKKGMKHPLRPVVAAPVVAAPKVDVSKPSTAQVDWKRRLRWVFLAFAPSSLMLGVTSYVSVDLSPFPLLWVVPLALYLLSFVLVFARFTLQLLVAIFALLLFTMVVPPLIYFLLPQFFMTTMTIMFYLVLPALFVILVLSIFLHPQSKVPWVGVPHDIMLFVGVLAIMVLFIVLLGGFNPVTSSWISFAGFFLVTMVCHGELAKDRPTTTHLTEYFLLMSVGGALGGLFNAMIAPQIFVGVAEYPIAILAACFLRPTLKKDGWFDELFVNAFTGFGTWVRDTGDNIAKSFGKPAPHNNWLLNYALDFLLALFVLALTLWIRNGAHGSWGWYSGQSNGLVSILKFFWLSERLYANALPLALYGPGMLFCAMFGFGRAFRFGLSMCALMFVALIVAGESREGLVYGARSYFGVLRVLEERDRLVFRDADGQVQFVDADIRMKDEKGKDVLEATYTYLMHGTTYHGRNYHEPPALRRVQTTYYHQKGPVGVVMDRYRWFKGPHGTFYADARLPVSMIGLGVSSLGVGNLPLDQLSSVWTEPPYATIGLGTGTMAGYGRWLQHVTFYEIDENIRNFSLPAKITSASGEETVNPRFIWRGKDPFFTYLTDAIGRGVNLEVIMGDARLSMGHERPEASSLYTTPQQKSEFYAKRPIPAGMFSNRDNYYKVIEVDAFSSDAIPLHLITREAIELYFSKLAPDGVVNMHTSNRHMNLVAPVTDIAKALGKKFSVGHDTSSGRRDIPPFVGHFGSEYVMLANEEKYLPFQGKEMTIDLGRGHSQTWEIPVPPGNSLWTDDFSNIVSILRFRE